jgi:hypothetical protein
VWKLGNLTEAQAGEKGMDMDALNSSWAREGRVVWFGDVMAKARWEL